VSEQPAAAQPGRPGVRALTRGLAKRCPNCGTGGLFTGYFTIRERCPACGLTFEREEGYWLGAMIVAIGVTEVLFGIWFIGGMLITWPDVPWTALLIGGLVLNLVVPIVGYPWSKTVWMGLHMAFVPPEAAEEAAAIAAIEADRRNAAIAARDARRAQDRDEAGDEARGQADDDDGGGDGNTPGPPTH
jgi:uncharacterized protein (DUF983 family)